MMQNVNVNASLAIIKKRVTWFREYASANSNTTAVVNKFKSNALTRMKRRRRQSISGSESNGRRLR